ncbi:acyl-CoA N-acyltransferase [Choiromyces venosus 120613-1]|uniref:Acyl-CoA N-acyltransferase n=1 Tax=Choiromyces venosus 120613-1 TaxID=1336337 RepID=A0A3N4JHV0_9PEZI|nr:acyl-CoA N-acyltransferase [Choiromyces venosus 120613-1]
MATKTPTPPPPCENKKTGSTIETPRLTFRPVALEDAPALHSMLSNREAMRYWSTLPHTTLSETKTWVAEALDTPNYEFAIVEKASSEVIGKIGYYMPEIGFIFHPSIWGRGYASEALCAFLKVLWGMKNVGWVIKADVDPRNERCLRLLAKFGFRVVGKAEGTYVTWEGVCGSVYLELERPEVEKVGEEGNFQGEGEVKGGES